MNESLQLITDWLEDRMGRNLHIRKEEQEDIDEVHLKLESKSIENDRTHASDGYTGGPALTLRGEGRVIQPGGEQLPLPDNTFIIPVEEIKHARMAGQGMTIETERGRYDISLSSRNFG